MINFPGEPDSHRDDAHLGFRGRVSGQDLRGRTPQRGDYSVTVIDYTEHFRRHRERTDGTEANSSNVQYRSWTCAHQSRMRPTCIARAAVRSRTTAGSTSRKSTGTSCRLRTRISRAASSRIFQHDARLYILDATVPRGYPPPILFQSSLGFLDDRGPARALSSSTSTASASASTCATNGSARTPTRRPNRLLPSRLNDSRWNRIDALKTDANHTVRPDTRPHLRTIATPA